MNYLKFEELTCILGSSLNAQVDLSQITFSLKFDDYIIIEQAHPGEPVPLPVLDGAAALHAAHQGPARRLRIRPPPLQTVRQVCWVVSKVALGILVQPMNSLGDISWIRIMHPIL